MPPATWVTPPFALFVLVDISKEKLEEILWEGHRPVAVWEFTLARKDYSSMPQRDPDESHEGTPVPIPEDVTYTDFIGSKIEDAAEWMKEKPKSVDVDANHFVILDRRAEKDGTIVICRLGDKELRGDKLEYVRFPAMKAALNLQGMESYRWEELNPDGSGTEEVEY